MKGSRKAPQGVAWGSRRDRADLPHREDSRMIADLCEQLAIAHCREMLLGALRPSDSCSPRHPPVGTMSDWLCQTLRAHFAPTRQELMNCHLGVPILGLTALLVVAAVLAA